jgi:hypothetical protein
MSGHIALHSGIGIHAPRAPDIIVSFEDDMVNEFLQLRLFMLNLVSQYQS